MNIKYLGQVDYETTWQAMKTFTDSRTADTPDELWVLEHPPVFTQGQAGKPEHLLNPGDIPVIQTDRGGQVTYHGPGQLIIYILVDLKRADLGVRALVTAVESAIIQLVKSYGIDAVSRTDAPGVYVDGKKLCSIGLRVRRGMSYHGLALNVKMDLLPFERINPCGYAQLQMTQLSDITPVSTVNEAAEALLPFLTHELGQS